MRDHLFHQEIMVGQIVQPLKRVLVRQPPLKTRGELVLINNCGNSRVIYTVKNYQNCMYNFSYFRRLYEARQWYDPLQQYEESLLP